MRHPTMVCLAILLLCETLNAQTLDSLNRRNKFSSFILPSGLIVAGLYATTDNDMLGRAEIREERNEHFSNFQISADDYLQFAPIAMALGMKAMGIDSKNDLPNSNSLLIKSEIVMGILVYTGKRLTAVPRPDTGTLNSFPSGHTAQAFMAATYLHKEFGKGRPWVPMLGYTLASCVGVLRVMNDRHWASDVLVGAGIGVLSTNVVYLTHRSRKKRIRTHTLLSTVFIPKGIGMALTVSL